MTYPDPIPFIFQPPTFDLPTILSPTPGALWGDDILIGLTESVNPKERATRNIQTWLTDFATAGVAPHWWNYVTLESVVRFDWIGEQDLRQLYELELRLNRFDQFPRVDTRDVDAPVRRTLIQIQAIRRLAADWAGKDSIGYHLGILFHAANRLAKFDPTFPLMPNAITRLAHTLLATAMLVQLLQSNPSIFADTSPSDSGLILDQARHTVWVNGNRVVVQKQSFDLLCYLYERSNLTCLSETIVETVFGQKYNESEKNKLNTAIRRLREKIEDDPGRPCFLLTDPKGYRLVPRP